MSVGGISRRASLRIPCLLRRNTYSLGRALRVGEMADRCFCNQSCNLHEEADHAGFITERLFSSSDAASLDSRVETVYSSGTIGVAFGAGTNERKVVILASTYTTYPLLFWSQR
jgi:hypothetical protein